MCLGSRLPARAFGAQDSTAACPDPGCRKGRDPGPCVACSLAEYPGPAFLPPVVINQPLLSRLTLSQNFYLLDVLLHLKLQTWPGLWIPDSLDLVSILF